MVNPSRQSLVRSRILRESTPLPFLHQFSLTSFHSLATGLVEKRPVNTAYDEKQKRNLESVMGTPEKTQLATLTTFFRSPLAAKFHLGWLRNYSSRISRPRSTKCWIYRDRRIFEVQNYCSAEHLLNSKVTIFSFSQDEAVPRLRGGVQRP